MQQRYAALLLLAAILFAGATVFSLCLLQPKRQHSSPSTKKYGLDAYNALAGLPIRKRSGGSVIPFLSTGSSPNERLARFTKQRETCKAYPNKLCQAGVVYSQCMLTNESKHAAPSFCLSEAFGRDALAHGAGNVSFVDEILTKVIEDTRIARQSDFVGEQKADQKVDLYAARQRAKHADLADGFLIDDEPKRS
jgi:hypothetical protein